MSVKRIWKSINEYGLNVKNFMCVVEIPFELVLKK